MAVLLPVADVFVVAYTQRPASEDDCADVVVEASGSDGFLVCLGSTGFLGQDESRSNPDGGSTQHQSTGQRLAIVDTAGSHQLDRFASEFGVGGFTKDFGDGRDENAGRDVTLRELVLQARIKLMDSYGVATTFTTLCADDVNIEVEALLDMLYMSDHVLQAD